MDLELIARELSDVVALVSGNQELARALTHPAIPPARKRAVVDALLSSSPVNILLSRTLLLLADRPFDEGECGVCHRALPRTGSKWRRLRPRAGRAAMRIRRSRCG